MSTTTKFLVDNPDLYDLVVKKIGLALEFMDDHKVEPLTFTLVGDVDFKVTIDTSTGLYIYIEIEKD